MFEKPQVLEKKKGNCLNDFDLTRYKYRVPIDTYHQKCIGDDYEANTNRCKDAFIKKNIVSFMALLIFPYTPPPPPPSPGANLRP